MIAGVTLWNFYFQIFERAIKSEQIIEFLKHLLRYIPGDILLIWDRLPAHRSLITQQFIRDQKGRLAIEYLPPYAPELNPKENLWKEIREKIFKNYALKSMDAVHEKLKEAALYIERNPQIVKSITSFPYIAKSF